MAKQVNKISFFSIYWRNLKGVFFTPWQNLKAVLQDFQDGSGNMPLAAITSIIIIGYIALLPLTLTLGAVIKSLVDFFTRKPLRDTDFNYTVQLLQNSSDLAIELCAKTISSGEYSWPKSRSSYALLQGLVGVNEFRIRSDIENTVKKRRLDAEPSALQGGDVNSSRQALNDCRDVNSSFKFTPEESAEITKAVNAERILQNQKNAVDHRAQLLAFFQAPHNTGKKMQHVIMDAVTTELEVVGYGCE